MPKWLTEGGLVACPWCLGGSRSVTVTGLQRPTEARDSRARALVVKRGALGYSTSFRRVAWRAQGPRHSTALSHREAHPCEWLLPFASFSYARTHQSSVLTLWPAYLFLPCDLRSSSRKREGDHSFPRLPGNSHLLHRGLLNRLYGGDRHCVPNEDHDQEARLQQPAGCAQADQAHPLAETGNRK